MQKPNKLTLIVIFGPPGVGKTTLADVLHDELAYTAHIGVDHIKRFISQFREIPAHQTVSRAVINAMAVEYLKNGINVIIEQSMSRSEVEKLEEIAKQHVARFLAYRLDAPTEVLRERTAERSVRLGKPLIADEEMNDFLKMHDENDYANAKILNAVEMDTRMQADTVLRDVLEK